MKELRNLRQREKVLKVQVENDFFEHLVVQSGQQIEMASGESFNVVANCRPEDLFDVIWFVPQKQDQDEVVNFMKLQVNLYYFS